MRALQDHRRMIEQEQLQNKDNYACHDLVLCTSLGAPIRPTYLYRVWKNFIQRFAFPPMTFHDLRHIHASYLLQQGVHPKVVSERLGHTSIAITMDVYSHMILPTLQTDAAHKLDELIYYASP